MSNIRYLTNLSQLTNVQSIAVSNKVVINEASKKQKTKHKHSLTDTATTLAHTEYSKLVVTRRTHASRLVS